jgi:hypothetical protein
MEANVLKSRAKNRQIKIVPLLKSGKHFFFQKARGFSGLDARKNISKLISWTRWTSFSTKFLIERAQSWSIFDFWGFDRIMAIGPIERKGSKLKSIGFPPSV